MTIKTKIFAGLSVVFLSFAFIAGLVFWLNIYKSYEKLETGEARRDLARVMQAIQSEIEGIETVATDWAVWDDTYKFVNGEFPDYVDSNIDFDTLANLDVNHLSIVALDGRVAWAGTFDLSTEEEIDLPGFPPKSTSAVGTLLSRARDGLTSTGIVTTARGPMMLSGQPVLMNNRDGPVAGLLVFARFLDDDVVADLRDQTKVAFDLISLPAADQILTEPPPSSVMAKTSETLVAETVLLDIEGRPAVTVRAAIPRSITNLGSQTILFAAGALLVAWLLAVLATMLLVQRIAITPLSNLTKAVTEIGRDDDLDRTVSAGRKDEIGVLASEFDGMLAQIRAARRRLEDQSYYTGMADVARGVLHNIRNALNPLGIGVWRLSQRIESRPHDNLRLAAVELSAGNVAVDRATKLLEFIVSRSEELERHDVDARADLTMIAERSRHIEEILQSYDEMGRQGSELTPVDLALSAREAKRQALAVAKKPLTITIAESIPAVLGQSTIVTQVLANLFLNAVEAIDAANVEKGEVSLTVEPTVDMRPGNVRVAIRDNGIGLPEGREISIFERGFTTKTSGGHGVGLHWCANSMAVMGGSISVASDGPGRGTTFHLTFKQALKEAA